jgi:hypothetical protein
LTWHLEVAFLFQIKLAGVCQRIEFVIGEFACVIFACDIIPVNRSRSGEDLRGILLLCGPSQAVAVAGSAMLILILITILPSGNREIFSIKGSVIFSRASVAEEMSLFFGLN